MYLAVAIQPIESFNTYLEVIFIEFQGVYNLNTITIEFCIHIYFYRTTMYLGKYLAVAIQPIESFNSSNFH